MRPQAYYPAGNKCTGYREYEPYSGYKQEPYSGCRKYEPYSGCRKQVNCKGPVKIKYS
jgi:hypothetical protein